MLDRLSSNSDGEAVITLADGQTITFDGVVTSSLTSANFVFNQTLVVTNTGEMVLGSGSMLPLT